jgi:hypothetical protein
VEKRGKRDMMRVCFKGLVRDGLLRGGELLLVLWLFLLLLLGREEACILLVGFM